MARYKLSTGQVVQEDTPFILEVSVTIPVPPTEDAEGVLIPGTTKTEMQPMQFAGVRYLTAAERTEYGITEIVEQPMPDTKLGYAHEDPENLGAWIVTPLAPEQLVERLMSYAAQKRWEKEVGGITLNGMDIATDDRSKIMIQGVRSSADANPNYTTPWAAGNTIVTLDAPTIITISNAVRDHVQNCFTTFASLASQIQAGTITTFEAIDTAFAS